MQVINDYSSKVLFFLSQVYLSMTEKKERRIYDMYRNKIQLSQEFSFNY
jgi:hypothetical protein